ncbi:MULTISPECIES: hypothetical protein [Campylobacter]|uniref:hypothetical protein n=1 Tax=Campylobacter TaxID=194 RepID=UPI000A334656|nr:hypothetical protein [Campylobacter sp. P0024]MCR8678901.1 hypothetical protein [Campylobacter sp. RM19072]
MEKVAKRKLVKKELTKAELAAKIQRRLKRVSEDLAISIKELDTDLDYKLREEAWEVWHSYDKIKDRLIEATERLTNH